MEQVSRLYEQLTGEQLDRIVKTVFATDRYRARLIEGGLFNTTYELEVYAARYILRIGPVNRHLLLPYEHHLMAAENFAYTQMKQAGIPTSDVLYCDTDRLLIDRDFMVVRAAKGQMLSKLGLSPEEKAQVYRDLGAYMKQLHQIREPMFGRLSQVLQGKGCFCWYDALWAMYIEWKSVAVRSEHFAAHEYELFEAVLRKYKDLLNEIREPFLTHCDLWENNVLAVRENGRVSITAIIDIDRAVCGDAMFEFGYDFMTTEDFKAGYGAPAEDADSKKRKAIYRMLCSLNDALIWYTEYERNDIGDRNRDEAVRAAASLL